jgi:hypothetical protein
MVRRQTEFEKLKKLFKDFGVETKLWTDPAYICDKAVRLKTVKTLCVVNYLDFCFDAKGKCIGHYTINRDSFKKRKKK